MNRSLFVVAVAALGLGIAASTVRSQDPPTKLAFLDVSKAFDTYRKPKEVAEKLRAKRDDILKSLKGRAKQIDEWSSKLETMNLGTDEAAQLDRQITLEKYALDVDKKLAERQLDRDHRKEFAGMYKELCQEAQAYGAEHGIAAVLLYLPPDADVGLDFETTRAVLCRDEQLDVTKDVVDRLNAQLPPAPVAPKDPPK